MKKVFKFPPGHGKWQSLIASITFLRDPIKAISRNMTRFSGTYSAHLLGIQKVIITENPDFIQYILRDNHSNYQKSELSAKTAARIFGKGLLFANGAPWLKQRRFIQPGFHHGKIQALQQIVAETVREFMTGFPIGENIEIYPLMRRLSFSVLIHSLFDIQLSEQTITELSTGFTDMQDFLLKEVNQPYRKFFYPINKAEKIIFQKSANIRKILQEIIGQRKSDPNTHHDLLDMLMQARDEDTGEEMAEEQMMDEILVMLFAGHETTANTLSWLLYLLATHPEVAGKLVSVVKNIDILESPRNEYINAVISESMRLYPAAWMTERAAVQDDHFDGYSFPAGTIIIPFFYGLHRNKGYWTNASSFDPERFIFPDPAAAKKIKYFFPFGTGPRMCIGNHFAMMEMSFILHSFLNSFEVFPDGKIPGTWPLITLRPKKLFLNVKKRDIRSPASLASV